MSLHTFVEGRIFKGGTAIKMSSSFNKVITIEKSKVMFDIANKNIASNNKISILQGDTREHLSDNISNNNNMLFWLDAHWSGGDTYDASIFLAPPPLPHDINNWPTIGDILDVIPSHF